MILGVLGWLPSCKTGESFRADKEEGALSLPVNISTNTVPFYEYIYLHPSSFFSLFLHQEDRKVLEKALSIWKRQPFASALALQRVAFRIAMLLVAEEMLR